MLSVLICTYNRDRYLGPLLNSIAANDLPATDYEIVLVDNNCTDQTHAVCQAFTAEHPDICFRYCTEPEQGLSAARNCAIRQARGEVLVYIDDDALIDPWYLRTVVEYLNEHPDISAVGGPILPLYETAEPDWMTPYTKALLTGWIDYGSRVRPFPHGRYPGGGNAAYRADVFRQVGLFNTALGRKGGNLMGSEEKDIFDKMRTQGMRFVYLPRMILHHIIPQYKLERDYFDRLTLQIGRSERQRTKAVSNAKFARRLCAEAIKWGATLLLATAYTLLLSPGKGWLLIRFRKNVTRGLLGQ